MKGCLPVILPLDRICVLTAHCCRLWHRALKPQILGSAQLKMQGQDGLAGHGTAVHGRGAEAGAECGLAGGLLHAEPGRPEDFDGADFAGSVEGELEDDGAFLPQASGLAWVFGSN